MAANLLPVSVKFKKENKELIIANQLSKVQLDLFVKQLEEGQKVLVTYEVVNDDASYAQLSKLHKCIRELAEYSGMSMDDMKLYVKNEAGLVKGDSIVSFADCSKEELSGAIQACINIGDKIGFPLY
jgi:hypothetical protein